MFLKSMKTLLDEQLMWQDGEGFTKVKWLLSRKSWSSFMNNLFGQMDRFRRSFKRCQYLSSGTTFVSRCIGMPDTLNTSPTSSFVLVTNWAQRIPVKGTREVSKKFSVSLTHWNIQSQFSGPMVIQRTDKRFQLAGIISWGN